MAEEIEKSFPFDTDEIDGEYDRTYLAEDFARYFSAFITSGVFMKESTNLQVTANGDMTVTLKPGKLIIDGYRYDSLDDIIIRLEPADGVLNRIDRISATWSKEDRDIHYTLQKGDSSYEPVPPECRRDDDIKDYVFADVYVKVGAVSISQADITDQRLNTEVCGIANPFNEIDTTSIFVQFTEWLNITREKGEADVAVLIKDMGNYLETLELTGDNRLDEILASFNEWLDRMKGQLSEDAAGHLQIEIDELREGLNEIGDPDFDDSGEIEGIASFTDFMEKFVKGTSIYQLFASLKAGLKYVLHAGQLVNNGLCEEPGKFPLDAAYGKALADQISQLYSEIQNFSPARLREALQYSGLGITDESTYDEILEALAAYFPNRIWLVKDGIVQSGTISYTTPIFGIYSGVFAAYKATTYAANTGTFSILADYDSTEAHLHIETGSMSGAIVFTFLDRTVSSANTTYNIPLTGRARSGSVELGGSGGYSYINNMYITYV